MVGRVVPPWTSRPEPIDVVNVLGHATAGHADTHTQRVPGEVPLGVPCPPGVVPTLAGTGTCAFGLASSAAT
jgi:hypothetical protein